jgi:simple sugar transport system substrate-binding protein
VLNWGPYYEKAVDDVLSGTWKPEVTKWGTKEGMNDIVKIADFVPAEARADVERIKAGLKDGSFAVFRGPIVDSTGREVLAKDAVADDAWKGKIDFYVKGVEGSIPSGR